jgi:dienelactone hydrolase
MVFHRVVCFYGSQIRTHKHIKPCVRVDLVLPKWEPAFDVEQLARELSTKPNVKIHRTPYRHGFMNLLSKNFSAMAYEKYIAWLKGALPHRSSGTGKP